MTQRLHKQLPDCQEQHVTHSAARRPGRMTQEQRNKGLSVPTISTIHKCPLDCCSLGGLRCLVSCPSLTLPLSAFPNRLAQKLRASLHLPSILDFTLLGPPVEKLVCHEATSFPTVTITVFYSTLSEFLCKFTSPYLRLDQIPPLSLRNHKKLFRSSSPKSNDRVS